jgi:hypothetical protein
LLSGALALAMLALAGCGGGGSGGGGAAAPATAPASTASLRITAVTPASGPQAGGTPVAIAGAGFEGTVTVSIGGRAATGLAVNAARTEITCLSPSSTASGKVDVVVTSSARGSVTSPGGFAYNLAPTITFVSPASGTMSGGTNLTILGTGFEGVVTVTIGNQPSSAVVVSSDRTQVTCVTPPSSAAGQQDLTVTASLAGSITRRGGFTYGSPGPVLPPAVSSITPASGPITGGTQIVIFGARFDGTVTVTVGGRAAASVAVNASRTQITCRTPAASTPGVVPVAVLSDATGSTTVPAGFTYNTPPVITSLSPTSGPLTGGTLLTISGAGFLGQLTVTVGGLPATSVQVSAGNTVVTCRTPAAPTSGAREVVVTSDTHGPATAAQRFSYTGPPPTISRISPTSGPNRGGTSLTIDGAGFQGGISVTVGGAAATSVVVNPARTRITCRTPPFASTGAADVVVASDTVGTVTASGAFVYTSAPAPSIQSISPASGPQAGGTAMTITGTNFGGPTIVTFGAASATGVTVNAARTQVTCTAPASPITGNVTVTVEAEQNGTATTFYTYNPPPTISTVTPASGPVFGSTPVTITGTFFEGSVGVTIGGSPATSIVVDPTRTQVTFLTPPAAATGARDVAVSSSTHGTVTRSGGFTYTANPAPTISAVTPSSGPLEGGTPIAIDGTNFFSTVTVTIDGRACSGVQVDSLKTRITCLTPVSPSTGAKTVTVTSSSHGSGSLAAGFTYNTLPGINSITPDSGPLAGGTVITIAGSGFTGSVIVRVGTLTAGGITVDGPGTQITCTTPAGAALGAVDVSVTSSERGTAVRARGFTYNPLPTIASVVPGSGPLAGSTSVTITGTGFGGSVGFTVGGASATGVAAAANGTEVSGLTPPGTSEGPKDVVVTSSVNGSALATGAFTYNPPPAVSSIAPASAPVSGGTVVTLLGTGFGGAVGVTFGGRAATGVTLNATRTAITCTTPSAPAEGAVNVVVSSTTNGSVTLVGGFNYNPLVLILTVAPASGPQAGGTALTIDGANFGGTVGVTVGSVGATGVSVDPPRGRITCTTAASPAFGLVNVLVTSTTNGTAAAAGAFTYIPPPPRIDTVDPDTGPQGGGTLITIGGVNFEGTVNVTVGGVAATGVTVNTSRTQITARTAAVPAAGLADVEVGSSTHGRDVAAGAFFFEPTPVITAVTPDNGPQSGGTTITIDGDNFDGAITVTIDGVAATNVSVDPSFTQITCTTPPGISSGPKPVAVASSTNGNVTRANGFTYNGAPFISTVAPDNGPAAGGTAIAITGGGYGGTVTVRIGDSFTTAPQCTSVTVNTSGTRIDCVTPSGTAGARTVFVSSSLNGVGSRAAGYTYNPAPSISNVTPGEGPLDGGTRITINGASFLGADATINVTVGTSDATNISVNPARDQITCDTPAAAVAASVDVIVTAPASGSVTAPGAFRYNPRPTVNAGGIVPASGPQQGGTPITITGTGFGGTVTADIGGVAVANLVVNLAGTQITGVTGSSTATGSRDVRVVSSTHGTVTVAGGFTYNPTPTITSIAPDNGPVAGGQSILITGANYLGTLRVMIGSRVAAISSSSSTTISAVTPPSASTGSFDVGVHSDTHGNVTRTGGYVYNPAMTITSFSPTSGPQDGGTPVVINGLNFGGAITVTFGGLAAGGVTVNSTQTLITCTTPVTTSAGSVDVVVTSSTFGAAGTATRFTYNPKPTYASMTPLEGPMAGGTPVTISGTNFGPVLGVTFGSRQATGVSVDGGQTQITCDTPDSPTDGAKPVVIISTSNGTITATDQFTYNLPPIITSFAPASGPLAGGTALAVSGSRFRGSVAVRIAGVACTNVGVTGDTTITCVTPAGASVGGKPLLVDSSTNGTVTAASLFTYNGTPSVSAISPTSGPLQGNTLLTIDGSAFGPTISVTIGGVAATSVTVNGPQTQITCRTPGSDTTGPKPLLISSTLNGTVTSPFDYTYNPALSVSSMTPTSGPAGGGTILIIDGTNFLNALAVTIGGVNTTGLVFTSARVTSTTPPAPGGVTGPYNVVVSSNTHGSATVNVSYTYNDGPAITSVVPDNGPVSGGTSITISGSGFFNLGPGSVTIGGAACTSITANVTGSQVTCVTPAFGSTGAQTVRVNSPSHGVATLANGFTFNPSFSGRREFTTGTAPRALAAADFNGDGKVDLAIANQLDNAVWVFLNDAATGATTPSFNPTTNVSFSTGTEPHWVAAGDVDRDGRIDIMAVNKISNTVRPLLNVTAPGANAPTFTALAPISPAPGTGAASAALADYNGDGKLDMVVACELSNSVWVGFNTSPGLGVVTYNVSTTFPSGASPVNVVAADLNGDGLPDFVTADRTGNTITARANTNTPGSLSTPTFGPAVTRSFPALSSVQGLSAGDMNLDGRLDVVASNAVTFTDQLTFFLNTTGSPTGDPSFDTGRSFPAIGQPPSVAIGDLDRDGRPDVGTANDVSNTLSFRLNETAPGSGTAAVGGRADLATGTAPRYLLMPDFNGDGKLDLVTANRSNANITAYLNNTGLGSSPADFTARLDGPVATGPTDVAAADMNRDGKVDLVTANDGSGDFSVVLNNTVIDSPTFNFLAAIPTPAGSQPAAIALRDLNGDGKVDAVVANSGSNTVQVFHNITVLGTMTAMFQAPLSLVGFSSPRAVAIGDLDLDGKPDIVVANSASTTLSVFHNDTTLGAGPPAPAFSLATSITVGSAPRGLAIGDLDGDGKPDIVAANSGSDTVTTLLNDSTPPGPAISFPPARARSFLVDQVPVAVRLFDYNGDGRLDLAVANQTSATLSVLRNNTAPGAGAADYLDRREFATNSGPTSIADGDLNGDGRPDLIVGCRVGDRVSVFLNNALVGSAAVPSLAARVDLTTAAGPEGTAIGDFNLDGRPDAATAARSGSFVTIMRNRTTP